MKLIVGLGNPGQEYSANRHNVGFMFVDFLIKQTNDVTFKFDKYLLAEVAQIRLGNQNMIIAKPHTYMNVSGDAVRKLMMRYKPSGLRELVVVHDDLDIPLGKFKIQTATGPKLHNGIESVEKAVGSPDFWRVRIGVENRLGEGGRVPGETYVLQDFTSEERQTIEKVFPVISARLISAIIAT